MFVREIYVIRIVIQMVISMKIRCSMTMVSTELNHFLKFLPNLESYARSCFKFPRTENRALYKDILIS